jgi:mannose-6-phosphate isomerase-like protein (cupin superfamily)
VRSRFATPRTPLRAYIVRMRVVNLESKLALINEPWKPHIVGVVNDSAVKLVKFTGEFVWHHHDNEDEMFLVLRGTMRIRTREDGVEREHAVKPGEFIIIPRGTEHCPAADGEVHVLLFEPQTTVNTGSAGGPRTVAVLPTL